MVPDGDPRDTFFMCQKLRKEKKFTSEETKAEIQSALDYEQVSLILH